MENKIIAIYIIAATLTIAVLAALAQAEGPNDVPPNPTVNYPAPALCLAVQNQACVWWSGDAIQWSAIQNPAAFCESQIAKRDTEKQFCWDALNDTMQRIDLVKKKCGSKCKKL
jgi:hypothetical protein